MSVQEKELNVKVTALSKYGSGVEQGVSFAGIEGWWKLDRDLQEKLDGKWPPAVDYVFRAKLRAKPKGDKPGQWLDIVAVSKATGAAESWEYGAGSPAASSAPAQRQARDTDTNTAIARQVVVKAEAEVLTAVLPMVGDNAERINTLFSEWRQHVAELWGHPVPAQQSAPLVTGTVEDGDTGGLGGDEIPFAPSLL